MSRRSKPWFRWYGQDARLDLGLRKLRRGRGGVDKGDLYRYVELCAMACESMQYLSPEQDDLIGGLYTGTRDGQPIPATIEDIALYLDDSPEEVRRFLAALEMAMPGRVQCRDNVYLVQSYRARQYDSPSDLPAQRAARQAASRSHRGVVTTLSRGSHDPVTPVSHKPEFISQNTEETQPARKPPAPPQPPDAPVGDKPAPAGCKWCPPRRKPTNAVEELLGRLHDTWAAARGCCPIIPSKRCLAALRDLRDAGQSADRIVAVVAHAAKSVDPILVDNGYSLTTMLSPAVYQGVALALDQHRQHGGKGSAAGGGAAANPRQGLPIEDEEQRRKRAEWAALTPEQRRERQAEVARLLGAAAGSIGAGVRSRPPAADTEAARAALLKQADALQRQEAGGP